LERRTAGVLIGLENRDVELGALRAGSTPVLSAK